MSLEDGDSQLNSPCLWETGSMDETQSIDSSMLDQDDADADIDMSGIDTASNASREDTCAKLELALRRKYKLPDKNGASKENHGAKNGHYEITDPRTLPGYQDIPDNCPTWKKAMIEKKNRQLEDEAKKQIAAQREEEERWKGVPEWKKALIMEKSKKKGDDDVCEPDAVIKEQVVVTEEQQAKLATMPEWKRDLLRKKRGDI